MSHCWLWKWKLVMGGGCQSTIPPCTSAYLTLGLAFWLSFAPKVCKMHSLVHISPFLLHFARAKSTTLVQKAPPLVQMTSWFCAKPKLTGGHREGAMGFRCVLAALFAAHGDKLEKLENRKKNVKLRKTNISIAPSTCRNLGLACFQNISGDHNFAASPSPCPLHIGLVGKGICGEYSCCCLILCAGRPGSVPSP